MSDQTDGHSATPGAACDRASRREFLKSSAGVITSGAAAEMLSQEASAQSASPANGELTRIQGRRRILLKDGVVLTMDRRVGDFAQADLLIEDGKIRDVRPDIALSDEATGVVDVSNRVVLPGFIDTHHHFYLGILRNILANGLLDPDK
jgi:5-methylthioadenosine/S-adenosylhomocysteine deaminase